MVVAPSGNSFNKELLIRRRITSIFNKRDEDFPSLKEHNDYLEEVEDMTWNLIEGRDVATMKAKLAQYEEENSEQIVNSRARKALRSEQQLPRPSRDLHTVILICMSLNLSSLVPPLSEEATDQNTQTGMSITAQGQYVPAIAGGAFMQPRPMGMPHQPLPSSGLDTNLDDEEMMKLKAERGGRAGGWSPEFDRRRVLEEAFRSLWM